MNSVSESTNKTRLTLIKMVYFNIFSMIEITVNDRLGKKVRVKCNEDDTIGDLKKLIAAQTGTRSRDLPIVELSRFPTFLVYTGVSVSVVPIPRISRYPYKRGVSVTV